MQGNKNSKVGGRKEQDVKFSPWYHHVPQRWMTAGTWMSWLCECVKKVVDSHMRLIVLKECFLENKRWRKRRLLLMIPSHRRRTTVAQNWLPPHRLTLKDNKRYVRLSNDYFLQHLNYFLPKKLELQSMFLGCANLPFHSSISSSRLSKLWS